MNIPAEFLKESQYEGSRLVEIDDKTILKYKGDLKKLQEEINPILDKTQGMYKELDVINQELQSLEMRKQELRRKAEEVQEPYQEDLDQMRKIDLKAANIKNKVQPLVEKFMEGKLGEFEVAKQLIEKDEKVYVEVFDEIEEKVKAIRAKNQKK